MLNRALSDDVAVRVTVEGLDGTNWRNIIEPDVVAGRTSDDLEAQKFYRLRLKGLWNPSSMPGLTVRLTHDNQLDKQPNPPDQISGPDFKRREVNEIQTYAYFETRNATTSLQASYDFGGGWVADGIVAYQKSRNRSVPSPATGLSALDVFARSTEISFEPKISYSPGAGSRTSFTVGGFIFNRDRVEGGVPGSAFVYDATDAVRTYSLFGDARIQVARDWDLLLGARAERESQQRQLTGTLLGVIPAQLDFDETVTQFLPKIGVEYQISPVAAIGIVGYTGYQAPGGGVDFLGTGGSYVWKKETAKTAEITWRSQWLNRTLTVNANLFYTKYNDYQIFGSDGGGGFIVKNAENVNSRGLELETTWRPRQGLSAFAQLGLLRARVEKFDDGLNSYVNGGYLPNAPKLTARVGGSIEALPGLSFGGDVAYTASAYGDVENIEAVFVPSYTTLNLNASYRIKSFTLTAFVNNVTDKFYLTSRLYPDGLAPRGYAGAPRTLGLSARLGF